MDTTATRTDAVSNAPAAKGIDRPGERPGVPMEAEPRGPQGGESPEPRPQETGRDRHLHRAALDAPTAVFGTSAPPRGVSGMMRRAAYQIPEHYARHWLLLMAADRIDVVEDRLGEAVAEPLERIGFEPGARYARTNPLAVIAGTLVGAWVAKKVVF